MIAIASGGIVIRRIVKRDFYILYCAVPVKLSAYYSGIMSACRADAYGKMFNLYFQIFYRSTSTFRFFIVPVTSANNPPALKDPVL